MEDGNESLVTMGMQTNYVDSKFTEGPTFTTDETGVSTITADTLHKNDKLKDMLVKHQDTIPQEGLEYLMQTGTLSEGERGVK